MRQPPDPSEVRSFGPLFEHQEEQLPVPTSPLHARGDPQTSRRSAREMRWSDRLKGDQGVCLRMIQGFPGKTMVELAQLMPDEMGRGWEYWRQRLGRRASELKAAGLVETRGTEDTEKLQRWWATAVSAALAGLCLGHLLARVIDFAVVSLWG